MHNTATQQCKWHNVITSDQQIYLLKFSHHTRARLGHSDNSNYKKITMASASSKFQKSPNNHTLSISFISINTLHR